MPLHDVKESKDYHFPTEEEATLKFWTEVDAFQEQLRRTAGKPEYSFYDGPPFATGLPHYGHILAGTLKACMLPSPLLRASLRTRVACCASSHGSLGMQLCMLHGIAVIQSTGMGRPLSAACYA